MRRVKKKIHKNINYTKKCIDTRTNVLYNVIGVARRMAVSYLTGVVIGPLRKEEAVSVSELFQFVTMLCAVAGIFYRIGKDINDNKKDNNKDTKT